MVITNCPYYYSWHGVQVSEALFWDFKSENIPCCPENVEACAAAYIRAGPLLKFGLIEANKKEEDGQTLFLEQVTSFLQHENIPTSEVGEDRKKALIMLAKFMEYLLAKILEMSGKVSRKIIFV